MDPKPRLTPIVPGMMGPSAQQLDPLMSSSMANLPNAGPTAYNEEMKRKILRAMLAGQK